MSICCAFSFSLLSFQGWGWDKNVCLAPLEDLTRALHFSFLEVPFPVLSWVMSFAGHGLNALNSQLLIRNHRSSFKCHGLVRVAPGLSDDNSQMVLCPACSPLWSQASPDLRCPGHARSCRLPGLPSHPEEALHSLFLFLFLFFP